MKRCFTTTLIFLSVLIMTACGNVEGGNVEERGNTNLEKLSRTNLNGRTITHFIDKETGCHYLMASGSGITPRINSDGKPYCE
ncbi:DUF6440 family protein [Paenibacillus sp. CAU 1782]